ncbi:polyphosphate kinase 1 [bacterium]|jgi:polyphosphate kinase|nr:polyphosphate kinase 1 [bacterium]
MDAFRLSPRLRPLLSDPAKPFIHRDLSWLQFNERVLSEAKDASNPLLERVKFLAISVSNLDEFFMIRMASLRRSISLATRKGERSSATRLTQIQTQILNAVQKFAVDQSKTAETLSKELEPQGVQLVFDLGTSESLVAAAKATFERDILPELQAPETYKAKDLNLLENLQSAVIYDSGRWFRIPKKIKPVLVFTDSGTGKTYLFFLDVLLSRFLGEAFGVTGHPVVIRLTRDADLTVDFDEEDSESIPDVIRSGLGKREKGRPIRLQFQCKQWDKKTQERVSSIQGVFKLKSQQVYRAQKTYCFNGLWSSLGILPAQLLERSEMVYPPVHPPIPVEFRKTEKIFQQLSTRDFLLHHPYDSFDAYVKWIEASCKDPDVTSIEMTVYRMDALSPVIELLKSACLRKKVRVVIELRARFDELNNLRLADELRKAGVLVTFGFGDLKVHAKVTLVTRMEGGIERRYTHLSTGNYNSVTARQYTDLAILTADPIVGEDARVFFDSLYGGKIPQAFKRLIHAPTKLHRRIIQLIDNEVTAVKSGKPGRIVVKLNALVDEAVIQRLYDASQAGVKIDLIVRGACSLIPGVKNLSENIRVVSIVDRFLEHSRIYFFETTKTLYLSSADWMPRNFYSRLELAFPVLDERLYQHLEKVVIPAYLGDRVKGRELTSDGVWKKRSIAAGQEPLRSQQRLQELADTVYKGTPLEQNTGAHSPRA